MRKTLIDETHYTLFFCVLMWKEEEKERGIHPSDYDTYIQDIDGIDIPHRSLHPRLYMLKLTSQYPLARDNHINHVIMLMVRKSMLV